MGKLRHGSSGKRSQALPAGWWQSWDVSLPPEVALGPCSDLSVCLSVCLSEVILPPASACPQPQLVVASCLLPRPLPQVDVLPAQSPASSLCPTSGITFM